MTFIQTTIPLLTKSKCRKFYSGGWERGMRHCERECGEGILKVPQGTSCQEKTRIDGTQNQGELETRQKSPFRMGFTVENLESMHGRAPSSAAVQRTTM
jgi:hypothetical protein